MTDIKQNTMDYRKEIDGLRAIAVLPVMLFHAGYEKFSGGFVGVDVFFVISGYLITTIILSELEQDNFSIVDFYERRARRILPALFFVMLGCIPFAWFWLLPSDMKDFSESLIAVSIFASNILFWQESGYFDTTADLKPLLHTWSLATEEQYYVLFPLFLMFFWMRGKRSCLVLLGLLFIASLAFSQWAAYSKPAAAFYLLPARGWELLGGAFAAFYLSNANRQEFARVVGESGGWLGIALIGCAVIAYDENTPFPSHYALVPTIGAVLIILFATHKTTVGKVLGNKIFVRIGLISYSAYLWHQPLFAFARHGSLTEPSGSLFFVLILVALLLAYFSWKYVEMPFRDKRRINRKKILIFSVLGSLLFICLGLWGKSSDGYKFRFDEIELPGRWNPPIECHGAAAISRFKDPLGECLGSTSNGVHGDIFLLGDSHAAQISFPLKVIAEERGTGFYFINTESKKDFPYSYFYADQSTDDRIFSHVLNVADRGDIVIISFHRGRLNEVRDKHLPLAFDVKENEKYYFFVRNMERQLKALTDAGIRIVLVKDAPLLSDTSSIEKCAYLNAKSGGHSNHCSVTLEQDLHTRTLQSRAFDYLGNRFASSVTILDPLPLIYGGELAFNPMNSNGTYRMFDRHHLTADEALKLISFFRSEIQ